MICFCNNWISNNQHWSPKICQYNSQEKQWIIQIQITQEKKHYETHNKKTAAKWHKWHWLIHFFVKVEWKNHVPWKLSSISRKWGKFGFHFIFSTFSFSLNVYDRSLYDISLFYFTIFMFHCFQIFHYFLRFSVFTNVLFIVQCFCCFCCTDSISEQICLWL